MTTQCKIPYYNNINCSSWPVVFSLIQKGFHVKFLVSLFSHFISITFTIYTFVLVRVFPTNHSTYCPAYWERIHKFFLGSAIHPSQTLVGCEDETIKLCSFSILRAILRHESKVIQERWICMCIFLICRIRKNKCITGPFIYYNKNE